MQQHPVFLRKIKDKVIVATILDAKDLKLPLECDHFILAKTESLPHLGCTMTLDATSLLTSEEYMEAADSCETTKGDSINGILRLPIWFNKVSKSIQEMMFG